MRDLVSPLYHLMAPEKAKIVFEGDALPAWWTHDVPGVGPVKGTSLSRNARLVMRDRPVRLVIDRTKLSRQHRIMPLDAEVVFGRTMNHPARPDRMMNKSPQHLFAEEFVMGDVGPLHECLIRVEMRDVGMIQSGSDVIGLYRVCRDYTKTWGVPFKVDREVLMSMRDTLRRWREDE